MSNGSKLERMEKEINKETIIRDLSLVQKEKQSKSKAMIDQKTDCVHEPQTVIKKSVGGEKKSHFYSIYTYQELCICSPH